MTPDPKPKSPPTFDMCSTAFPISYERTCKVEGYIRSNGESCGVSYPLLAYPSIYHSESLKFTMSQIHSLKARFPKGEERYSSAYSGSPSATAKSVTTSMLPFHERRLRRRSRSSSSQTQRRRQNPDPDPPFNQHQPPVIQLSVPFPFLHSQRSTLVAEAILHQFQPMSDTLKA